MYSRHTLTKTSGGYIVSAIFISLEYWRLGVRHRNNKYLRLSFYVKLVFIIVELGLAIAFGVLGTHHQRNTAAILEWIIALVYAFYVWSFAIDFLPALSTKHHHSHETTIAMAEAEAGGPDSAGSETGLYPDHHVGNPGPNVYPHGHFNGSGTRHYAPPQQNGFVANGHPGQAPKPANAYF